MTDEQAEYLKLQDDQDCWEEEVGKLPKEDRLAAARRRFVWAKSRAGAMQERGETSSPVYVFLADQGWWLIRRYGEAVTS